MFKGDGVDEGEKARVSQERGRDERGKEGEAEREKDNENSKVEGKRW